MKSILSFILLFLLLQTVSGQVITIVDAETGEKLEFVNIISTHPKAITVTNSQGQASISLFGNASEITIQLLGYESKKLSFKEIKSSNFNILLNPIDISLDQIVISATKWHQTKSELTSKISTVIPKDVEFQNPQTAADMLNISGDVFIQKSQQGGGSPMLRGFATNRVLISVDGVRMNNAIFRSGNIQNIISLDPFSIENTEILFGPGSIIYGSDAIGGAMNFYTLTPQFALTATPFIKGNAQYRFSSANNENTGHFDINLGWKHIASITSISYNSFGNLNMGKNGPNEYLRNEFVLRIKDQDKIISNGNPEEQIRTKYNQLNILQKFRYRYNADWYIDYGLHFSATSDYDRYDRLIIYRDNIPKSAEWYYGPQKWLMHNVKLTNIRSNGFYDDMVIRAAYQNFEESRNDRDFEDIVLRKRIENVNSYSFNVDLNKELNETSKFLYGFESVLNTVNSIGIDKDISTNTETKGPARYPNSDWSSIASYLTYQKKFIEDLFFQSGLRYNYFYVNSEFNNEFYPLSFSSSKINNGALTGSLGFVYTPFATWSIGLNLSSGFRAPNVDDIGKIFDSEPGSVVVPNPDLRAEKAYNIEIGIAKVFSDNFKIDLTWYYTYLEDAMVRRDFNLNGLDSIMYNGELSGVQAIQNAANAYVYGIQGAIELKFVRHLLLSANINYQFGEEELDNGKKSPLRHAPPLFGDVHLTYRYSSFRSDLYLIYNGEISNTKLAESEKSKPYIYAQDKYGNPYSPAWHTFNFKASYTYKEYLMFVLGIENITDQRYRPYSSGVAAPGRNLIFSSKYFF